MSSKVVKTRITKKDMEKAAIGSVFEKSFKKDLRKRLEKVDEKTLVYYRVPSSRASKYLRSDIISMIVKSLRDEIFGKGKGPDVIIELEDRIVITSAETPAYVKMKKSGRMVKLK